MRYGAVVTLTGLTLPLSVSLPLSFSLVGKEGPDARA